ncbi:hypothetical protein [Coleofasciculus sp. FACHB-129]|uniref:hypothetical protein n=1 Tax=Cyanophyceae TaxID=3028117 RepID=UPI0018F03F9B|nr:hypothetical protein [Coleofasciculus sp. FACHB-129]
MNIQGAMGLTNAQKATQGDPNAAAAQRAKQFADAEKSRRLVAAAHVSFPGVSHIRADNQGYAWVPVDYRWRE